MKNELLIVLATLGASPAVYAAGVFAYQRVMGRFSWNRIFRLTDMAMTRIRRENPEFNPRTIISIGFGGFVLTPYVSQYFGDIEIRNVELTTDSSSGARKIDRHSLSSLSGSQFLVVSGVTYTGLALATVLEAILHQSDEEIHIISYSFFVCPPPRASQEDGPLAQPLYHSVCRRHAALPWYSTRPPGRRSITSAANPSDLAVPHMESAAISSITVDLTRLKQRISLRSESVLDAIAASLLDLAENHNHFNVLIGGPAASGKSMLARLLCQRLDGFATYLPLDACVRDSVIRDGEGFNGCQRKAYEWSKIAEWTLLVENKAAFSISPYNHATRRTEGELKVDGAKKLRIIEWVFALAPECPFTGDCRIVLQAPTAARRAFWLDRYLNVRQVVPDERCVKAIEHRVRSTKEEISPTLRRWDIRFALDEQRMLDTIDSNIPQVSERLAALFRTET